MRKSEENHKDSLRNNKERKKNLLTSENPESKEREREEGAFLIDDETNQMSKEMRRKGLSRVTA